MRSKSFMSHDASGFLATEINPMSKILILLVMNFLIFFTRNSVLISAYFVISIALLASSGVSPKSMKAYISGVSFMIILCFLSYTFLSQEGGDVFWRFGILSVSKHSMQRGAVLAMRVAALVLVMITYLCITNQQEMILGLRALHVPYDICFVIALAFRFAGIFPEDINIIMQAQQARGVNFHHGGLIKRIRSWVSIGLPVVSTYINHVQKFSNALECHGYKWSQKRNFFTVIKFKKADYIVIVSLALLMTASISAAFLL